MGAEVKWRIYKSRVGPRSLAMWIATKDGIVLRGSSFEQVRMYMFGIIA